MREWETVFDYVIVGAGSAGCVLASRLSEDPDVRVLLLEAGPPDTNENIHVPLGYLKLGATEIDWDYHSAPEQECLGRRITLPRGKVLGGSSSINAMVYIRGNRLDYDGWGVPGWSWADLLPYFVKAEDNERGATEYHGAGGPLPVSDERSHNRISHAFADAGEQCGLGRNEDFNGAQQDGLGLYQVTQRGGMRASAAVAYLHPAMERPNLTVMPYMHVQRDRCSRARARWACRRAGWVQAQELRAEREVILCGGSYNSPQLLMLSGDGAGGAPDDARDRRAARPPRGGGEPVGPRGDAAGVDDARAGEPAAGARARGAGRSTKRRRRGRSRRTSRRRAASRAWSRARRRRTCSFTSRRCTSWRRDSRTRRRTACGSRRACSRRTAAARCASRRTTPRRSRSCTTRSTPRAMTCGAWSRRCA